MNLWLSPHGIWYYRKVTTLPCGRRKEIKKSLHTRDKLTARAAVAKLLACARSRPKPIQLPAEVNVAPHEQSVARNPRFYCLVTRMAALYLSRPWEICLFISLSSVSLLMGLVIYPFMPWER